jgi:hypothetical protein
MVLNLDDPEQSTVEVLEMEIERMSLAHLQAIADSLDKGGPEASKLLATILLHAAAGH